MFNSNGIQLDFQEQCMIGDKLKVECMLRSGFVDPYFQHKINGWTGLHWASKRGHEAVCLLLIEAGFDRDAKDNKGRTAYDVCPVSYASLREILRPDNIVSEMPEASGSRSGSTESDNGFIPSYIRNPIFPYIGKATSFDTVAPSSPTANKQNYYSYGRRDSLNRTRFLLLRTSVGEGKETYKRITLPGGSSVEQLKKLIEKATQRPIISIITLPDNILVEADDQIQEFANSQKIEVIYGEPAIVQSAEIESAEKKKMEEQNNSLKNFDSLSSGIPIDTSLIDIPTSDDVEPATDVSFPTDSSVHNHTEHTEEVVSDAIDTSASAADESSLSVPTQVRASTDSDPGDYVKVEHDEPAKPAEDIKLSSKDVENKESPKAVILEKSKLEDNGGLNKWIDDNPDTVRLAASIAAVASVAGIGLLIYARKFK